MSPAIPEPSFVWFVPPASIVYSSFVVPSSWLDE